jgi:hypothetical protein
MEINWIRDSNDYSTRCDTFHFRFQSRPIRRLFDVQRLIVISEVGNIDLLECTQQPSHWCARTIFIRYHTVILLNNDKQGIPQRTVRTCLCSCNFVGMLPEDIQFDSRLGHSLSWLRFLWFSSLPPSKYWDIPISPRPLPSKFIIHKSRYFRFFPTHDSSVMLLSTLYALYSDLTKLTKLRGF